MHTPWGDSQGSQPIAPGITEYHTPGQGGIRLTPRRQAQMPDYLRLGDADKVGWYGGDYEWSLVVCAFPQFYDAKIRGYALATLQHSFPDKYERHTGRTLARGESWMRDLSLFHEEHRNDYLVWHTNRRPGVGIPDGYVGVAAVQGLHPLSGVPHNHAESRYFLVPEAEYDASRDYSFVVDPARHTECLYRDGRFVPMAHGAETGAEETEGPAPR